MKARSSYKCSVSAHLPALSLLALLWAHLASSAPTPQDVPSSGPGGLTPTGPEPLASIESNKASPSSLRYDESGETGQNQRQQHPDTAQPAPSSPPSSAQHPTIHIIDDSHQFDMMTPSNHSPSGGSEGGTVYNIVIQQQAEKRQRSAFINPDVGWLRQLVPRVADVADQPENSIQEAVLTAMDDTDQTREMDDIENREWYVNVVKSSVDSEAEVQQILDQLQDLMRTGGSAVNRFQQAESRDKHPHNEPPNQIHKQIQQQKKKLMVINIIIFNLVQVDGIVPDASTATEPTATFRDSYLEALAESQKNKIVKRPDSPHHHHVHHKQDATAYKGYYYPTITSDGRPMTAMEQSYLPPSPPQTEPVIGADNEQDDVTNQANIFFTNLADYQEPTVDGPEVQAVVSEPDLPTSVSATATTSTSTLSKLRPYGLVAVPLIAGLATTSSMWLPALAAFGKKRRKRSSDALRDRADEGKAIDEKFLALLIGKRPNSTTPSPKTTERPWDLDDGAVSLRPSLRQPLPLSHYSAAEAEREAEERRKGGSGGPPPSHSNSLHVLPVPSTDDFDIVANFVKSTLSKMVGSNSNLLDNEVFVINSPSIVNSNSSKPSPTLLISSGTLTNGTTNTQRPPAAVPSSSLSAVNVFTATPFMPMNISDEVTNSPVAFYPLKPGTPSVVNSTTTAAPIKSSFEVDYDLADYDDDPYHQESVVSDDELEELLSGEYNVNATTKEVPAPTVPYSEPYSKVTRKPIPSNMFVNPYEVPSTIKPSSGTNRSVSFVPTPISQPSSNNLITIHSFVQSVQQPAALPPAIEVSSYHGGQSPSGSPGSSNVVATLNFTVGTDTKTNATELVLANVDNGPDTSRNSTGTKPCATCNKSGGVGQQVSSVELISAALPDNWDDDEDDSIFDLLDEIVKDNSQLERNSTHEVLQIPTTTANPTTLSPIVSNIVAGNQMILTNMKGQKNTFPPRTTTAWPTQPADLSPSDDEWNSNEDSLFDLFEEALIKGGGTAGGQPAATQRPLQSSSNSPQTPLFGGGGSGAKPCTNCGQTGQRPESSPTTLDLLAALPVELNLADTDHDGQDESLLHLLITDEKPANSGTEVGAGNASGSTWHIRTTTSRRPSTTTTQQPTTTNRWVTNQTGFTTRYPTIAASRDPQATTNRWASMTNRWGTTTDRWATATTQRPTTVSTTTPATTSAIPTSSTRSTAAGIANELASLPDELNGDFDSPLVDLFEEKPAGSSTNRWTSTTSQQSTAKSTAAPSTASASTTDKEAVSNEATGLAHLPDELVFAGVDSPPLVELFEERPSDGVPETADATENLAEMSTVPSPTDWPSGTNPPLSTSIVSLSGSSSIVSNMVSGNQLILTNMIKGPTSNTFAPRPTTSAPVPPTTLNLEEVSPPSSSLTSLQIPEELLDYAELDGDDGSSLADLFDEKPENGAMEPKPSSTEWPSSTSTTERLTTTTERPTSTITYRSSTATTRRLSTTTSAEKLEETESPSTNRPSISLADKFPINVPSSLWNLFGFGSKSTTTTKRPTTTTAATTTTTTTEEPSPVESLSQNWDFPAVEDSLLLQTFIQNSGILETTEPATLPPTTPAATITAPPPISTTEQSTTSATTTTQSTTTETTQRPTTTTTERPLPTTQRTTVTTTTEKPWTTTPLSTTTTTERPRTTTTTTTTQRPTTAAHRVSSAATERPPTTTQRDSTTMENTWTRTTPRPTTVDRFWTRTTTRSPSNSQYGSTRWPSVWPGTLAVWPAPASPSTTGPSRPSTKVPVDSSAPALASPSNHASPMQNETPLPIAQKSTTPVFTRRPTTPRTTVRSSSSTDELMFVTRPSSSLRPRPTTTTAPHPTPTKSKPLDYLSVLSHDWSFPSFDDAAFLESIVQQASDGSAEFVGSPSSTISGQPETTTTKRTTLAPTFSSTQSPVPTTTTSRPTPVPLTGVSRTTTKLPASVTLASLWSRPSASSEQKPTTTPTPSRPSSQQLDYADALSHGGWDFPSADGASLLELFSGYQQSTNGTAAKVTLSSSTTKRAVPTTTTEQPGSSEPPADPFTGTPLGAEPSIAPKPPRPLVVSEFVPESVVHHGVGTWDQLPSVIPAVTSATAPIRPNQQQQLHESGLNVANATSGAGQVEQPINSTLAALNSTTLVHSVNSALASLVAGVVNSQAFLANLINNKVTTTTTTPKPPTTLTWPDHVSNGNDEVELYDFFEQKPIRVSKRTTTAPPTTSALQQNVGPWMVHNAVSSISSGSGVGESALVADVVGNQQVLANLLKGASAGPVTTTPPASQKPPAVVGTGTVTLLGDTAATNVGGSNVFSSAYTPDLVVNKPSLVSAALANQLILASLLKGAMKGSAINTLRPTTTTSPPIVYEGLKGPFFPADDPFSTTITPIGPGESSLVADVVSHQQLLANLLKGASSTDKPVSTKRPGIGSRPSFPFVQLGPDSPTYSMQVNSQVTGTLGLLSSPNPSNLSPSLSPAVVLPSPNASISVSISEQVNTASPPVGGIHFVNSSTDVVVFSPFEITPSSVIEIDPLPGPQFNPLEEDVVGASSVDVALRPPPSVEAVVVEADPTAEGALSTLVANAVAKPFVTSGGGGGGSSFSVSSAGSDGGSVSAPSVSGLGVGIVAVAATAAAVAAVALFPLGVPLLAKRRRVYGPARKKQQIQPASGFAEPPANYRHPTDPIEPAIPATVARPSYGHYAEPPPNYNHPASTDSDPYGKVAAVPVSSQPTFGHYAEPPPGHITYDSIFNNPGETESEELYGPAATVYLNARRRRSVMRRNRS